MSRFLLEDNYWVNRTLCDVLDEMRKCHETRNYAGLMALVEEAQSKANRMEAGLGDKKDLLKMEEEWHTLRKEIKKLRKERDKLKKAKKK